MTHLWRIW